MERNNVMAEWVVHMWPQTLIHLRMLGYAMSGWQTHPWVYLHHMAWVDTVRLLLHNCSPFKKGRRIKGRGWQWVMTTHANIQQHSLLNIKYWYVEKKNQIDLETPWHIQGASQRAKVLDVFWIKSTLTSTQPHKLNIWKATFPPQPQSKTSTWPQYPTILIYECQLSRLGRLARSWEDWVATDSRKFREGYIRCL